MNNYYDYKELRDKAIRPDSTKTDRLALLDWMQQHGTQFWNGECYDIDDGLNLYPVYTEVDEDEFEITDAVVK